MAVIETWLHQDLQEPVKVNHLDGNLFSNNGNGNRIGVVLTNNGEDLASISGTVSGYVVTSDGSTVPCTGSKSGNRASILIPAAAYQPGSIFITVFVTDGTTVTTIGAVSTTVMRSRTNAQVDPGSAVTDWTQTINAAMQSVETAAANLGGIVAVPYASITFPVPLGKYTYYNNNLYRCITPIESSESFTASHWTQVRLGDDVSNLKSALTNITENEDIPLDVGWARGRTNPFNKTTSPTYCTVLVACVAGDVFSLCGAGGNANRLWFFVDSEGTIKSEASANASASDFIAVEAPTGATYFVYNSNTSVKHVVLKGDAILRKIKDTQASLAEARNALISNNYSVCVTDIPSNADYNDYLTPGNYRVATSTIANTLGHRPTGKAGKLIIISMASDNHKLQIYIDIDCSIYKRSWSLSGGFGNWVPDVTVQALLGTSSPFNIDPDNLLYLYNCEHYRDSYYNPEQGGKKTSPDYEYFMIPVESGEKYYIYRARFVTTSSTVIENSEVNNYEYPADFTGYLYVTFAKSYPMIVTKKADYSAVRPFNAPSFAPALLKQSLGNSTREPMSQAAVTQAIQNACANVLPTALNGKIIASFGDSIMAGAGNSNTGLAEILATKYGMTAYKCAIGGAAMGRRPNQEYSQIKDQITTFIARSITPDVILLNGGTNDMHGEPNPQCQLGDMSTDYNLPSTSANFSEGFETAAYLLKTTFPDAVIVYVRTNNIAGRLYDRQITYGERAIDICHKWAIYVADVYNILNTNLSQYSEYMDDATHPNGNGYEYFYIPEIERVLIKHYQTYPNE